MKIFLITFQTDSTQQNQIIERIKARGAWARLTSTTWCVKVNGVSANSLRDELCSGLNNSDRIFVVDISESYWASYCIPNEVTTWLNN